MTFQMMKRVTKKNLCPICNKPDWCLAAEDGSAAICQRIEQGSVKRCGDAGWLHLLKDRHDSHKRHTIISRISIDFGNRKNFKKLAELYKQQLTKDRLFWLSKRLNLSAESLIKLNVGWDGNAFTFPMSNVDGRVIGIRRRFPNGAKVSVKGSKTGLFIPTDLSHENVLLICEGPSDTAAALDLGFSAIGRPNCNSLIKMTASAVKGHKDIVIVGDNDLAGKTGAERLAKYLALRCSTVRIIYPSDRIKDLRDWLRAGLTHDELLNIIDTTKSLRMELR